MMAEDSKNFDGAFLAKFFTAATTSVLRVANVFSRASTARKNIPAAEKAEKIFRCRYTHAGHKGIIRAASHLPGALTY